MPTYQYRCTSCGHDLEVVQKFTDPALTECPVCSGGLRKIYNAVGVVFKGSGFYRTDSRAGAESGGAGTPTGDQGSGAAGDKGGEKAGDKADKKGSDKGDGKGDGKPAPGGKPKEPVAAGSATSTGSAKA